MKIMIGLLFAATLAIAGLSWRCIVLQQRYGKIESQIRLQTSQNTDEAAWHKIASSTVDMVTHDWIVIDTQERKLEETPEVVQLVCKQGGGTLQYCTQLAAPIIAQLKTMRSDVESMRQSKDGAILEIEKLEKMLPAPR